MKKTWASPKINTINITETQYAPKGGSMLDGYWTSKDGEKIINTYS